MKMLYTVSKIKNYESQECVDGSWKPARSINYKYASIWQRFSIAFKVFCGKYDALEWN